jgi:hypothetical protein
MRRFSLRHNGAGDRPAADNPMHGRVPHLPARVVHVLISSETTKHRLPQQTYQRMAAGARIGESFDRHLGQAECVASSWYANNPASDVSMEPRNWSIKRWSKSSLRTPSFDSPPEFAIAAPLDPR